jgi:hypothetical protein
MTLNAALTTITRSNVGVSFDIAIVTTTMNTKWQRALMLSTLAIAKGRTAVGTISLKS